MKHLFLQLLEMGHFQSLCSLQNQTLKFQEKWVFYIGQITDLIEDDEEICFDVEFYRQSRKCPGRLIKSASEDSKSHEKFYCDVPAQTITTSGTIKRVQSMLKYPIDLDGYKFQ